MGAESYDQDSLYGEWYVLELPNGGMEQSTIETETTIEPKRFGNKILSFFLKQT